MGWVPAHTLAAFKPPPRRIPTRAMPNREMIETSTESKNWQVGRQAWDSIQRKGYLHGKKMPVLVFEREQKPKSAASAPRYGNVDAVNLSNSFANTSVAIHDVHRLPLAEQKQVTKLMKAYVLDTLIHEFAHTAQPRPWNPPRDPRRFKRYERDWQETVEGGATLFARLVTPGVTKDLTGESSPTGFLPPSHLYAQRAAALQRKYGRNWRSYALYGQFGLKDPRGPLRP